MINQKGKIVLSMNEKYNLVLQGLSDIKGTDIEASYFDLDYDEFEGIINELESDELINKGEWSEFGKFYHSQGLTFNGKKFIENNDSKEYHKIEKTEINNHHLNIKTNGVEPIPPKLNMTINNHLNIKTNHGIAVAGNNNIVTNSEFNQQFIQLIQEIQNSNIDNKNQIIHDLNKHKEDKAILQSYLETLLTRGAEVATLVSAIGALLGMLG